MREQRKSPVRELSLSPVREDHSPVRVASKTGKKQQDESNDSGKRKKIWPSEEVFNQYASQTDEIESQGVQSLNFDKVQKTDNRELIKSSLKPEFRTLCSANNELTELLFGDNLTQYMEDVTMTNKLKRSGSYNESKYSNNKYSKDYAHVTLGSLF